MSHNKMLMKHKELVVKYLDRTYIPDDNIIRVDVESVSIWLTQVFGGTKEENQKIFDEWLLNTFGRDYALFGIHFYKHFSNMIIYHLIFEGEFYHIMDYKHINKLKRFYFQASRNRYIKKHIIPNYG